MKILAVVGLVVCHLGGAIAGDNVAIGGGGFLSVLPNGGTQTTTHVGAFRLDRTPVTNGQFLDFVLRHREWQRSRVPALFADTDYLSHWEAPDRLGAAAQSEQPVTRVSWYAARAYCEESGGRLPTWSEWE